MKTIKERQKFDMRFKRISKAGRFIRKHISSKLGNKILDWNDDKWFDSY